MKRKPVNAEKRGQDYAFSVLSWTAKLIDEYYRLDGKRRRFERLRRTYARDGNQLQMKSARVDKKFIAQRRLIESIWVKQEAINNVKELTPAIWREFVAFTKCFPRMPLPELPFNVDPELARRFMYEEELYDGRC
jgi:hypothetical protein